MKLIRKGILPKEHIINVGEIEELLNIEINNIYKCLIDLENGRVGIINMFYNINLDCIHIQVQELGILTNNIFIEQDYLSNEGEFGLQISASNDNYEYYEKYKLFINEMIFEIYKNNEKVEEPA
ncbi:hypothetical protein CHL78_000930 [Romboutsia weinsteinii]|uniref:Uncharacterized protein n=1 Tax=Romboutsia weinsteinii TaxID=2020949 RepID=A0A371JAR2_9FIRM|nr:hypothetical protein [Romboutsia weinsteinii]RDY29766.1 hypothetical protein CHL78_000930 [Romboutsia weinsteinii]